jgi:alpha-tubulin suppressor-like RCC1 family protein/uncharacterized protein YegL
MLGSFVIKSGVKPVTTSKPRMAKSRLAVSSDGSNGARCARSFPETANSGPAQSAKADLQAPMPTEARLSREAPCGGGGVKALRKLFAWLRPAFATPQRSGPLIGIFLMLAGLFATPSASAVTPTAVAAGYDHSLAIGNNGKVYAWGYNTYGQLGNGSTTSTTTPVVVALPAGVTATVVGAGNFQSLAIGSNAKLYAWGWYSTTSANSSTTPVVVSLPAGVNPTAVAENLALGSDGKLYTWGDNTFGTLGNGSTTASTTPVVVSLPAGVTATAVAAGNLHRLAKGSDGKLYAWGSNASGQLGDGSTTNRTTPVVVSLPAGVTPAAVSAGDGHSLALGSDAKLYAWGGNTFGTLGNGSTTASTTPVMVSMPAGVSAIAVAAGRLHSLAMGSDGKLYAWGSNNHGQLGDGSTATRTTPVVVSLPAGVTPAAVSAKSDYSLALGSNGKLYTWGGNTYGQLGNGSTTDGLLPLPMLLSPQTISFSTIANQTLPVSTPLTVSATASSGLSVSLTSTTPSVCTISGISVSVLTVGICTLTADQAGDANYDAATQVTQSFTVSKGSQTISFSPLANQTLPNAPFNVSATASSGLTVSLTSTTLSVCTISGSTVTILATGSCTIAANQAGDVNYNAATQVSQSFTVAKGSQTISFDPLANLTLPAATQFTVSVTASSGLAANLTSTTPIVCTISGNTVTILAVGTCTIAANQGGDANYNPAPQVTQSFTVSKSSQTIIFAALANQILPATPFTVSATASSGLAVNLTGSTPSVCTISGTTVTVLALGTCTLAANQAGDANYNAAPQVTQSFTVSKGSQTISFGALADQILPATPFTVGATATSGLVVSFSASTPSVCTISGTTVTVLAAGTCSIAANQAGNANYGAAPPLTQSFTVSKGSQTISFGIAPTLAYGGTGTQTVTATSGLAVSLTSTTLNVCTISGSTVTAIAAGTCTIAANQAGNANYDAAAQVTQSFTVSKGNQTISFGVAPKLVSGGTGTVIASATSGLAVSLTSPTLNVCSVSGITVTGIAAGTCTIAANQAGNANYNAATEVTQSFAVPLIPTVPAPITVSAIDAVITSVPIAAFLKSATAVDADGKVFAVTNNAPTSFPLGLTTVTFSATDAAGNVGTATSTVTVVNAYIGLESATIPAVQAVKPANVSMQFRAFDSVTGKPLSSLKLSNFKILQDSSPLSVESYVELKKTDELNHRIDTVLMLDISSSINTTDLTAMKQAAKAVFLDANFNSLLLKDQRVAIYVFDTDVTQVQDFTDDPHALSSAIDSIALRPLISGSTNLYGAIVTGMGRISTSASLDNVVEGQMVLITDGRDTAGFFTLSQAQAATANNLLFVLGVQNIELNVAAINSLTSRYTPIVNFSSLEQPLRDVNQYVKDYSNSFYQILYTTPARAGTHVLNLSVVNNSNVGANATISGTFDATGFSQPPALVLIKGDSAMAVGTSIGLSAVTRMAAPDIHAYSWSIDDGTKGTLVQGSPDGSIATLTANQSGMINISATDSRYPGVSGTHSVFVGDVAIFNSNLVLASVSVADATAFPLSAQTVSSANGVALTMPAYTWSIANTSVAHLDYSTGSAVNLIGLANGTTSLTVTDNNNGKSVTIPVLVTGLTASTLSQTISFGIAPTLSFGSSATVSASATSGLVVSFQTLTPNVCTISGTTVTALGVGTCTIVADQAGNASYSAAAQATQTITIGKLSQTITFGAAPSVTYGSSGLLIATGGGSGNPVVFSTQSNSCRVNGSTVSGVMIGACTVTANQAGNANYEAAVAVSQGFGISQGSMSIIFSQSPTLVVGGSGSLSAAGSVAGAAVVFTTLTPTVCTVSGSTVNALTVGTCTVAANRAATAEYVQAQQVTQSIDVNSSAQTLSLLTGWNLVGNGIEAPITVATTFSDPTKVATIWKWVTSGTSPAITYPAWAFYTPGLVDGGQAYAASKGYDFLTVVNAGDGYWVNVKTGYSVNIPTAVAVPSASFSAAGSRPLMPGWSLIASGDNPTPSFFDNALSLTPPTAGTIQVNVTSLWAWDTKAAGWYFWAPSLANAGTLGSYLISKGYLDFGSKALDPQMGFWVNHP